MKNKKHNCLACIIVWTHEHWSEIFYTIFSISFYILIAIIVGHSQWENSDEYVSWIHAPDGMDKQYEWSSLHELWAGTKIILPPILGIVLIVFGIAVLTFLYIELIEWAKRHC